MTRIPDGRGRERRTGTILPSVSSAREHGCPPPRPDTLPPRLGGRPSPYTYAAPATGRPAGLARPRGARRSLIGSARALAAAALLALSGALALPATVQADTTDNGPHGPEHTHFYVWRTTITVGVNELPAVSLLQYGYIRSTSVGSISTSADFGFPPWNPPHKHHVDRDSYKTVSGLWVNQTTAGVVSKDLLLRMPELPDVGNVTLWIGHKSYPLSSATYKDLNYEWKNIDNNASTDLNWKADDPDTTDENEADQVRVALVYERQLPSAPENVSVTAPDGEVGTLKVSWDAADAGTFPIECYLVEFRHPSGEAKKRKQSYPGSRGTGKGCGGTPPTSVKRTDLEAGTEYKVLVQALSGDGFSEWSDMKTARPTNRGRALGARFVSPPERHDGTKRIKVRVEFSEAPENVGADGVEVEGGRVTSVRPVGGNAPGGAGTGSKSRSVGNRDAGQQDREVVWEFEIEPDSDGDVTVSIEAGRPCDEEGAICTADGRSLSEGISTTVEGPDEGPPPLTAWFADLPEAHDGESAFRFRVAFSEPLSWMNGRRLREDVVAVAGGRATSASRVNRRRDLWELTVEPDSPSDVTVTVAAGAACGTPAAVCTKDGRALSETISATVRGPAGSSAASAPMKEDLAARACLALAGGDGLAPGAAAAALWRDGDMDNDQLAALDSMGNGNGRYDLGDLLAWINRCRPGPGSAAGAGPPSSAPPALPASQPAGGASQRRKGARGPARRRRTAADPPAAGSRTRRSGWLRTALLAVVALAWGCGDGIVAPHHDAARDGRANASALDPGPLHVRLTAPAQTRDIGAMLVIEGPAIDSLQAPGLEMFETDESSSTRREVVIAGALPPDGPVLRVWVPHRGDHARYRVRLLQVAAEDFTLGDLSVYGSVISR